MPSTWKTRWAGVVAPTAQVFVQSQEGPTRQRSGTSVPRLGPQRLCGRRTRGSLLWIRWPVAARRVSSSRRIFCKRMQGIVLLGIFLRITPFLRAESGISEEQLLKGVEKSLRKYFGKRGEQVGAGTLESCPSRLQPKFIEVPAGSPCLATAATDEPQRRATDNLREKIMENHPQKLWTNGSRR